MSPAGQRCPINPARALAGSSAARISAMILPSASDVTRIESVVLLSGLTKWNPPLRRSSLKVLALCWLPLVTASNWTIVSPPAQGGFAPTQVEAPNDML